MQYAIQLNIEPSSIRHSVAIVILQYPFIFDIWIGMDKIIAVGTHNNHIIIKCEGIQINNPEYLNKLAPKLTNYLCNSLKTQFTINLENFDTNIDWVTIPLQIPIEEWDSSGYPLLEELSSFFESEDESEDEIEEPQEVFNPLPNLWDTLKKKFIELFNRSIPKLIASIFDMHLDLPEKILSGDFFNCPISLDTIIDPTITPQGTTYSHSSISALKTDPLTRKILTAQMLRSNNLVQDLLTYYRKCVQEGGDGTVIPPCLICNQTQKLFVEPVVAADGNTYELYNIERYLDAHQGKLPSGAPQGRKALYPNRLIENLIKGMGYTTEVPIAASSQGFFSGNVKENSNKSLPHEKSEQMGPN